MEVLLDPTSPWRHEGETSSNGHLYFRGFKPMIGVLLNFSQNHLDRHKDMDEYFAAKKRLFMNQDEDDFAVLNFQDPLVRPLADDLASQIRFFNGPQSMQDWMKQNPNFSAVTRVAQILGINPTVCQKVCEEFKGVEHRMEWVRDLKGVDFINDSKSTTVEATRWALERLQRPVVMICGGRDKQMDYSVLAPLVQQKVKKMLVIGEAREKIRQSYQGVIDIVDCDSLDAAVQQANKFAQPGDCVLLSPMCASFDMFRDFEDRGKVFKEIVGRLA
jgi:UDP-N-acetylmuramoylalanine--D-glutamate ligase